ncbi:MAG: hypothetical protein JWO38_2906 [Gemmataceae bacterium]|nr:hypothetical protein [Gemmataceae bacterium]
MSTAHPPNPTTPPGTTLTNPPPAPPAHGPREIKLVSHSPIFYWWPIWLLGYVMALITWAEGNRLAILPAQSEVRELASDDKDKAKFELVVQKPLTKSLAHAVAATADPTHPPAFKTRVSEKAWIAPVYCVVLLLTILITNVPLRGLWSFLVILMLIVLALIFTVFDVWEHLLGAIGNLHIYINMAGYLFIATTVLILWAVSVFVFDQRTYMIISPGQIRVCEHIGASIRNFDTTGLSFEKQRDDLFRHWILGFFSGDLVVRTSGAEKEEIRFPNVLWIGWRLEQVQEILRERATVVNP